MADNKQGDQEDGIGLELLVSKNPYIFQNRQLDLSKSTNRLFYFNSAKPENSRHKPRNNDYCVFLVPLSDKKKLKLAFQTDKLLGRRCTFQVINKNTYQTRFKPRIDDENLKARYQRENHFVLGVYELQTSNSKIDIRSAREELVKHYGNHGFWYFRDVVAQMFHSLHEAHTDNHYVFHDLCISKNVYYQHTSYTNNFEIHFLTPMSGVWYNHTVFDVPQANNPTTVKSLPTWADLPKGAVLSPEALLLKFLKHAIHQFTKEKDTGLVEALQVARDKIRVGPASDLYVLAHQIAREFVWDPLPTSKISFAQACSNLSRKGAVRLLMFQFDKVCHFHSAAQHQGRQKSNEADDGISRSIWAVWKRQLSIPNDAYFVQFKQCILEWLKLQNKTSIDKDIKKIKTALGEGPTGSLKKVAKTSLRNSLMILLNPDPSKRLLKVFFAQFAELNLGRTGTRTVINKILEKYRTAAAYSERWQNLRKLVPHIFDPVFPNQEFYRDPYEHKDDAGEEEWIERYGQQGLRNFDFRKPLLRPIATNLLQTAFEQYTRHLEKSDRTPKPLHLATLRATIPITNERAELREKETIYNLLVDIKQFNSSAPSNPQFHKLQKQLVSALDGKNIGKSFNFKLTAKQFETPANRVDAFLRDHWFKEFGDKINRNAQEKNSALRETFENSVKNLLSSRNLEKLRRLFAKLYNKPNEFLNSRQQELHDADPSSLARLAFLRWAYVDSAGCSALDAMPVWLVDRVIGLTI